MPSEFHRRIGREERDTPEQVEERITRRAIAEQAVREREERFGTLTPANAQAAIDWQTKRITELETEAINAIAARRGLPPRRPGGMWKARYRKLR